MRTILVFFIFFAMFNCYAQQNNNTPALGNSGSLQADSSKYLNSTTPIQKTPELQVSEKAEGETDTTRIARPALSNSAKKEEE